MQLSGCGIGLSPGHRDNTRRLMLQSIETLKGRVNIIKSHCQIVTENSDPLSVIYWLYRQMSTSDSADDDELSANLRKRAFPASRTASSQVLQLTSTLKVVLSNYGIIFV